MKIATGKADVEHCLYIDDATKKLLGAATRPPIRLVKIGVGERKVAVGGEVVQFRHEKTFYHPPAIMVNISDTWSIENIQEVAKRVEKQFFTRVGQDLFLNGVAIRNDSHSPEQFGTAVAAVEACSSLPEVLIAGELSSLEKGLAECGNYRALIHGATEETWKEMTTLTKKFGCPLTVKGQNIDELAEMTELCIAEGIENLVLDFNPSSLGEFINTSTKIRKAAIQRTLPAVGYPILLDTTRSGFGDAANALGVLKYASVIITNPLSYPKTHSLLTLRQNIYTDPQKPIQVTPGIYRVNNPGKDAPLLLTVNFSLTYFTVLGYLESANISSFLLIVDTEGLSVLTAVAAGKLNEFLVKDSLKKYGVAEVINHRTLIIPGYAAPLSGKIQDETGWQVKVGPRDAAEIAEFLDKELK